MTSSMTSAATKSISKGESVPKTLPRANLDKKFMVFCSFDHTTDAEHSPELGICQVYTGKVCEKYMRNQTVFISPETTMEQVEMKLHRAFGVIKESKDMNSICANFALPSLCITVLPICRTPEETNHYYFLNKNKAKSSVSDKFITKRAKKTNKKNPKTKSAIPKTIPTEAPPSSTSTTTTTAKPTTSKPKDVHASRDIEFSGNSNSYYEPDSYTFAPEHPQNHLRRKRRNIDIDFLSIRNNYPPTKHSENLRRICRSDCELLENEICQKEYAIAKRHPTIGQILPLEDCNEVPDDDDCLRMGINVDIDPDETCYWDNGNQYRGVKDRSINGRSCLKWSKVLREITHIELANNNYCRNPDASQAKPWCYVDKQKTVELCDIPKCSDKMWFLIICALILFLLTTMLITLLVCCKKRGRQGVSNIQNVSFVQKLNMSVIKIFLSYFHRLPCQQLTRTFTVTPGTARPSR